MFTNKKKRGVVFTLMAFFISMLLFSIIFSKITQPDYSRYDKFKKSRILFLNSEIQYFKNTYMNKVFEFSLYKTLFSLTNYTKTHFSELNQNYSKLNDLVYEGMTTGKFDGNVQPDLENATIDYFVEEYRKEFIKNYNANFSFDIKAMNVYEKEMFYVNLQVIADYNFTTFDNISHWSFEDENIATVSIFNLFDPEFMIQDNKSVPIKYARYEIPDLNWGLSEVKQTINRSLANSLLENAHKYTIGNSYFDRLLNVSRGSYFDVGGFWSFDYDIEKGKIYDTALKSNNISNEYRGNTRLFFTFDGINGSIKKDITFYNNSGVLGGDVNCSLHGIKNEKCAFDGDGDYIDVNSNAINLNSTNEVSVSFWVKPNDFKDFNSDQSYIFRYGNDSNNEISVRYSADQKLEFVIGKHGSSSEDVFKSNSILPLNNWTHVVCTFNGQTKVGKIFFDGEIDNMNGYNYSMATSARSVLLNSNDIFIIGGKNKTSNFFNGSLDEFGFYSEELNYEEVLSLYKKESGFFDYKDSLHGKGVEFDGVDDFINLGKVLNESDFNHSWSFDIWFKSYNLTGNRTLFYKDNYVDIHTLDDVLEADVYLQTKWVNVSTLGLKKNLYYYLTLTWEYSTKNLSLYLTAVYLNSTVSTEKTEYSVLKNSYIGMKNNGSFFNGLMDEIKFYNRTLKADEIIQNYYNYDSFSKGCCNYITLVNPNKMGYNTSAYKNNVSYSAKLFYDYYKRNIATNDILLMNLTNITSAVTTDDYYNFLFDPCILEAYHIGSFRDLNITLGFINGNVTGEECYKLVNMGIY